MKKSLFQLDKNLKNFLAVYIFVLTCGVMTGLAFLHYTTDLAPEGAIKRFNGNMLNNSNEDFDIPENYPKPISEMLTTTHNHIIGFSLIFVSLGLIFYFNSIITGSWKMFLMIEPLISAVVSFASIWGMRYVDTNFVYLTIISASLIYLSYFLMAGISFYELIFKKRALQVK